MKNYLVLYYSKTGNSEFIAQELSQKLACDSKRIIPVIDNVLILFLLSLVRINIPTNISVDDILSYDEVIVIGPVWGGQLISPLRTALNKSVKAFKDIHFAVTCETKDEERNNKYGYGQVLKKARDLGGKYLKNTDAFSMSLVNSVHKSKSPKLPEKIKLTEENFSEVLKSRVENFIVKIMA